MADRLAHDLAGKGLTIVSGLARGCDGAAHRGALDVGGLTVAVLGCGADVVYPPEHRALYQRIVNQGAVVSELPPGARPLPGHFPRRNRIISGLSAAVVVVEASRESGSLITAGCALEQGREVMAVPGNVLADRHGGCHDLLRDGARLVQSAEDVLEELGWRPAPPCRPEGPRSGSEGAGVALSGLVQPVGAPDTSERLLAYLVPGEEVDLHVLAQRCGLDASALLGELTRLELAGRVERLGAGRFVRPGR